MNALRTSIAGAMVAAGALLLGPMCFSQAQATPVAVPPESPVDGHHRAHGPWHMFEKLGLTAEQKNQVKAIFEAKGRALQSLHEQLRTNNHVLQKTSPDDANYTTLVAQTSQSASALTAQLVIAEGDLRAQLYAVLTPAQKTQLAALEAQMEAKFESRSKEWGHQPPSE